MSSFRDAVNTAKAFKKLNYKVYRTSKYGSQANRAGQIFINRYEKNPVQQLAHFLPYAHQSATLRGFSALTNPPKVMETSLSRLVKLNSKLPGIINFEDEDYKPRRVERGLIGNPLSIAIHGKKGERFGGAAEALGRNVVSGAIGSGAGIAVGGGIGAGLGALRAAGHGPRILKESAAIGGLGGAYLGGLAGGTVGSLHATYGKKAEEMYKRRTYGMESKLSRLVELSSKLSSIVEFRYDDDRNGLLTTGAVAGGSALAGVGGTKAYQAIKKRQTGSAGVLVGGEHAGLTTAPTFASAATDVGKEALQKVPGAIKSGLQTAGQKGMSALDRILSWARLARKA